MAVQLLHLSHLGGVVLGLAILHQDGLGLIQQADGADVERGGSFHRSRDIGNSLIITYKVQIQNGVPGKP